MNLEAYVLLLPFVVLKGPTSWSEMELGMCNTQTSYVHENIGIRTLVLVACSHLFFTAKYNNIGSTTLNISHGRVYQGAQLGRLLFRGCKKLESCCCDRQGMRHGMPPTNHILYVASFEGILRVHLLSPCGAPARKDCFPEGWVWLRIRQEGPGPCFHLPGQPILKFRFIEP